MKNKILYVTTVLIWGSTWLAIEYQLGSVAVEVSLAYSCLLYTSPSPRDLSTSRMPSSA